MIIKVLGSVGCVNCEELYNKLDKIIKERNLDIELKEVTSILEIVKYKVKEIPALVIDEKVVCEGIVPSDEEIDCFINGKV